MWSVLSNKDFRFLYLSQCISLLGTGFATLAFATLAFDLAVERAGEVLGVIYALKMIAYVVVAPLSAGLFQKIPARKLLVILDLIRAALLVALFFTHSLYELYGLAFLMFAASAAFTPVYQSVVPQILPDEQDYTKALSASRIAYDLENIASPLLAAVFLSFASGQLLFIGTALCYGLSAFALTWVYVSHGEHEVGEPARLGHGVRLFLATPRLRALVLISFATAAAGAFVIVNTVTLVRSALQMSPEFLAYTMTCFGAGSLGFALAYPRLAESIKEKSILFVGGVVAISGLAVFATGISYSGLSWSLMAFCWGVIGIGFSALLTPVGKILTRSCYEKDRRKVFAGHFSISHACWLITYPLAGYLLGALGW